MNEELTNILMTLPEGIILINEETGQVTLGNKELIRLFKIHQTASPEEIN